MTPAEVKFALDAKLVAMAKGGLVPVIVDLHSLVVEGESIFAGFEIVPDLTETGVLFFEFERPSTVGRDEIAEFTRWLAWPDNGTIH
jgi:hypothetical protein